MNSKEHQQYLAGEWWQKRRRAFLAEVPFCETCGLPRWLARIAYDQDLHVHHLSYEHIGAEHDRDLQALCRRCHELEHQGRSDFKQPPRQAICRPCGKIHYNIYSDLCDGCEVVHALNYFLNDPEFKSLREFSHERLMHMFRRMMAHVADNAEGVKGGDSLGKVVSLLQSIAAKDKAANQK
jgi:hypothetical protein